MKPEESLKKTTSGKLAVGDTCRLKSGGPLMTVDATTTNGVVCKWFDRRGSMSISQRDKNDENWTDCRTETFNPTTLQAADK